MSSLLLKHFNILKRDYEKLKRKKPTEVEIPKDIYLVNYGIIDEEYDKKVFDLYSDTINKCKNFVNEHKLTECIIFDKSGGGNKIMENFSDEELMICISLKFVKYIESYCWSLVENNLFDDELNPIDSVLLKYNSTYMIDRLCKLVKKPNDKYRYFLNMCESVTLLNLNNLGT